MLKPLLELVVAPALVGAATLAARRWGQRLGGLVSAFPVIAGSVLLIDAHERGAAFASRAASATLAGLVTLSVFVVVYARVAQRAGWRTSLAAGWAAVAAVATGLSALSTGLLGSLAIAALSLLAASLALPPPEPGVTLPAAARWELPVRMGATALLVVVLAAAAAELGPYVGGVLTALPVLASILAAFTHAEHGPAALTQLLRGMVAGMAAFVVFCALVAALVEPAGVAVGFAAAALGAIVVQAAAAALTARYAAASSRYTAAVSRRSGSRRDERRRQARGGSRERQLAGGHGRATSDR